MIDDLVTEIGRQDTIQPEGYPPTRNGCRLGLASAQDELDESLVAWRNGRCKCYKPDCNHHDWSDLAVEVLQTAAVLMRVYRSVAAVSWEPELGAGSADDRYGPRPLDPNATRIVEG